MMNPAEISAKTTALRRHMQAKLGVKSQSLPQALKRAGRRLPRRLRRQGQVLVRAEQLAGHPKLARQINAAAIDVAYREIDAHLRAIDLAELRKGRLLNLGAAIAANLLVVIVGFLVWLWWRGYV